MKHWHIKFGNLNAIVVELIDKQLMEKGGLSSPMGKWKLGFKHHLIWTLESPVSLKEADSTEGTYCSQHALANADIGYDKYCSVKEAGKQVHHARSTQLAIYLLRPLNVHLGTQHIESSTNIRRTFLICEVSHLRTRPRRYDSTFVSLHKYL